MPQAGNCPLDVRVRPLRGNARRSDFTLTFLRQENNDNDEANNRQENYELPPAAPVCIV